MNISKNRFAIILTTETKVSPQDLLRYPPASREMCHFHMLERKTCKNVKYLKIIFFLRFKIYWGEKNWGKSKENQSGTLFLLVKTC